MNNDFSIGKYYELLDGQSDIYTEELKEYFLNQNVSFNVWKDHIAELADVKTEDVIGTDADGNQIVKHIRYDGNIFQQGTPVNAETLGRMEWNDAILDIKLKTALDTLKSLALQVSILNGQNSNNMPYNSFVANARNINEDVALLEGWYDETNERGVI